MINYTKDYDTLINAQCVIIANNQNYLNDTDYKVIREKETGELVEPEVTEARAQSRLAIQSARTTIAELEEEKRREEEEAEPEAM